MTNPITINGIPIDVEVVLARAQAWLFTFDESALPGSDRPLTSLRDALLFAVASSYDIATGHRAAMPTDFTQWQ